MVQEFVVLRCKTCWMFQCLPANKSNKFECSRCLDTQFIINVFKRGTRAQCNRTIEFLEENVEEGVEDKDILKEIEEREARLHRKRLKKRGKENEDQFGEKESMTGTQEEWEEQDELMEDMMMMESTDDRTPTTEDSQTDNSPEPSPEDVRDEGFIDGVSVVLSPEARDRIMKIGLTQTSSSVVSSNAVTSSLPPISSSSHSSSPSSSSFSPPLIQRYIPIDYSTSGHSVNGKACEEEPREDCQSGDLDSPHSAKRGRFS